MERDLTREQGFALLFEAHAARQLLGTGCHLLIADHGIDGKFDALATVWSIGVEKMLKVTLGLANLSAGERWPNGKSFGHNLLEMNSQLIAHLDRWQSHVPQSQWIAGLIQAVRSDPIWPPLLAVLDTYACSGRFAYLDTLAEVAKPPLKPRPLWDKVESAALSVRPELHAIVYASPPAPIPEFNAALLEINTTIAQALARWWFTVTRAGAFHAYGEQGRRFTPELEPRMTLPPLPVHLLPS
jgi:hypothetical protein